MNIYFCLFLFFFLLFLIGKNRHGIGKKYLFSIGKGAEIRPLGKGRKSPVLYVYQFMGFKVIAIRAALKTNFEVLDLSIDL